MTLVLCRMRAHARIEGWSDQDAWSVDDYVVVDERRIEYAVVEDTVVGRIYKETIHGEPKWRWFLQTVPAPHRTRAWQIPWRRQKRPLRGGQAREIMGHTVDSGERTCFPISSCRLSDNRWRPTQLHGGRLSKTTPRLPPNTHLTRPALTVGVSFRRAARPARITDAGLEGAKA
jgi:hypothetical protein